MARRVLYLLAALAVAAIAMLAGTPAALAHATLESTSPADGAVVARAPASVSATFDEQVGVSPTSLQVYAPNGQLVDAGPATHGAQPSQVTVRLVPGLGKGTYTVGWHVISADSHPVQGAFTFSVGAPSSSVVTAASLAPPAGRLVGVAFGAVRWLAFAAFALLIGAVAFVICCWPGGAARPGVLRLVMGAWGALAAATLAAILLQGAYGAGEGIGKVFWPNVLHATLYSRYGRCLGVRLVLVVAALVASSLTLGSLPAAGRRTRLTAGVIWAALTAGLAATWALADHAGTGIQVPLAVPSDMLHLSAMAVWGGGLVTLAAIVLRRPAGPGPGPARRERRRYQAATADAAQAVSRFSPIALGCVATLIATGTYQAWRGTGSWDALFLTTYGQLLLAKIGAMCTLIALGYLARHRVARLRAPAAAITATATAATPASQAQASQAHPALVAARAGTARAGTARARGYQATRPHRPGTGNGNGGGTGNGGGGTSGPDEQAQLAADQAAVTLTRLRWSVALEVAIIMGVLAVTAILVNSPTARETYKPPASASAPFNTGGPHGTGQVSIYLTPAGLGPNQLRLTVTTSQGHPWRPQQVQAVVALPARNLGPLPVKLTPGKPGTYTSSTPVIFTITGQWQVQVTIRSDAFDETTITIPVTVH